MPPAAGRNRSIPQGPPPLLSVRSLAAGWYVAWRLVAAVLLPAGVCSTMALTLTFAWPVVSPALVGWYCAAATAIAPGIATRYFVAQWADRVYARALPYPVWWGVLWR